ncbi:hypothetical protein BOX37_22590 [Nocardia mangyaensis]|uniref:Lipid/polyisoprenoid-binding YceI-like domain-containing protein n=1 Tax=Nocardia mangyaensis TaxID=2213200 RepID=A0A1J0VW71_9NOCA|nr:YceI family protein [Nocardia mangyaensis]APE36250.1 hypothetical protein BOX37_22590 [Nocardia mangyaensis]
MNLMGAGTRWTADPEHSGAVFQVAHFGGAVHGNVPVRAGLLALGPDGQPITVSGVVDLAAISTGNPRRDRDLRKPRFLDLDRHPRMTFTAEDITTTDGQWRVAGVASARGRTVPLIFTVDGFDITDTTVALTAHAVLDRKQLGLRAPNVLIGRWVDITVRVVLRATAPAPAAARG